MSADDVVRNESRRELNPLADRESLLVLSSSDSVHVLQLIRHVWELLVHV